MESKTIMLCKPKNFDHGKVTSFVPIHITRSSTIFVSNVNWIFFVGYFTSTLRLWYQSKKKVNVDHKGAQSAMGTRRPELYFCQFEKRLPQPEVKDTSRHPLQSCLVFHSILDLLQKTSFWENIYSSHDIILSYLVKNSTQRNMNRRGEKRVGAGRKKSPSFTKIYQNNKRNETITLGSK